MRLGTRILANISVHRVTAAPVLPQIVASVLSTVKKRKKKKNKKKNDNERTVKGVFEFYMKKKKKEKRTHCLVCRARKLSHV